MDKQTIKEWADNYLKKLLADIEKLKAEKEKGEKDVRHNA